MWTLPLFFCELTDLADQIQGAWIVLGDFNLLRHENDKNNNRFDHRLASLSNETISALALDELPLLDRLYTWSNLREQPTLARLDRAFISSQMSSLHPNTTLTSLIRTTSDHTPLLVTITTNIPRA
jgi:endonuclease/exonuclease/phosphatase family metal-dependent hydrolase